MNCFFESFPVHCRERIISTVVETMSNTDTRQIENQIRPQGREKAAKRLAGGMVVYVR